MMIPQTPAVGVLLNKDFGDAMLYTVACDCDNSECSHALWVEADDLGVSVTINTTQTSDWWSERVKPRYDIENEFLSHLNWFWASVINGTIRKIRMTYNIWVKGYVKYESCVLLSEQNAINYANVLITAIQHVKTIHKNKKPVKQNVE